MQKKPRPVPGDKFGRLTVEVVYSEKEKDGCSRARCQCKCDCGKLWSGATRSLTRGRTRSCGCLSIEVTRHRALTHGGCGTRLHSIWKNMRSRCSNQKAPNYQYYGGEGVRVCEAWQDFMKFQTWALANGYEEHLTIDRKDGKKGYSPGNCRFVTQQLNVCNRRLIGVNNTTGFRGVYLIKPSYTFRAGVVYKNTAYGREGFPTAEAAAKFRDALVVVNGWPLPLNFPAMTLEEAQALVGDKHPKGVRKK